MPDPTTPDRDSVRTAGPIAARCTAIAESTPFNVAIFAVIVANAVVLGLETYDSIERDAGGLLDVLNDVFLAIFVIELAIRLAAFGSRPRDFFRSGWNVFDFVVIAASFTPGLRENATLLRLIRLARIVRIVRLLPDLRILVTAMARSLPGVASLGVLIVLLLYIYGIVGWVIFDEHDPDNYGTIGEAMLTLFVLLSLENLPDNIEMGLELSVWTVPYFVSYVLLAVFLVFNLLIGVVISSLEEAHEIESRREDEERRAAAESTDDPADDRRIELVGQLQSLRRTLEAVERDIKAIDEPSKS